MTWTISQIRVEHNRELMEYFQCVGRALYITNSFEAKLKSLYAFVEIDLGLQSGEDFDEVLKRLSEKQYVYLQQAIAKIGVHPGATGDMKKQMSEAVLSRNWIAHESCSFGPLEFVAISEIRMKCRRLFVHLKRLVQADFVVSAALYSMSEPDSRIPLVYDGYWSDVRDFVLVGKTGTRRLRTLDDIRAKSGR